MFCKQHYSTALEAEKSGLKIVPILDDTVVKPKEIKKEVENTKPRWSYRSGSRSSSNRRRGSTSTWRKQQLETSTNSKAKEPTKPKRSTKPSDWCEPSFRNKIFDIPTLEGFIEFHSTQPPPRLKMSFATLTPSTKTSKAKKSWGKKYAHFCTRTGDIRLFKNKV